MFEQMIEFDKILFKKCLSLNDIREFSNMVENVNVCSSIKKFFKE